MLIGVLEVCYKEWALIQCKEIKALMPFELIHMRDARY